MPHLWMRSSRNESEWVLFSLDGGPSEIFLPAQHSDGHPGLDSLPPLLFTRWDDPLSNQGKWVLIASADTTLNGLTLSSGIRVLRDKDEIRSPGNGRMFFSSERLAKVETFSAAPHAVVCPRCKQPVLDGAMAVRCPACGVVHHQTNELPCWLGYVDSGNPFLTCAMCDHPSAVDAEARFRWSPEGI